MCWIVVVAVLFMMVYMTMGARLGVVAKESPATLIANRAGRWLAALIGIGVFFISAAFQFGNNLGVHSAFLEYEDTILKVPFMRVEYLLLLFNGLAITFVFGFSNLYRAIERVMMVFVAIMLLSFAINLIFAFSFEQEAPDRAVAADQESSTGQDSTGQDATEQDTASSPPKPASWTDHLALLGLVGTTFVITAAYNQAYLVQQKGWGKEELQDGLIDARIGSVIMALITMMLIATAAAVLRNDPVRDIADIAGGLRPAFGAWGHTLFCVGLFSAAYSSFLVNSMIGGFILADGLGLGSKPTEFWPKMFTVAVLLTGMIVALLILWLGFDRLFAIIAAQAVTVVAAPGVAGAMLWLANREDVMGSDRNKTLTNVVGGIGFVLLLAMAGYTAFVTIPGRIERLRENLKQEQAEVGVRLPQMRVNSSGIAKESSEDAKRSQSRVHHPFGLEERRA